MSPKWKKKNLEQGENSNNPETSEDENQTTEANLSGKKEDETSSKRWMVTNRLDPSIGRQQHLSQD
jgi:hypothetical protein